MHLVISSADINSEDEMEQLRASVDFLVELCETNSPVRSTSYFYCGVYVIIPFHFNFDLLEFQVEEANVANWSHQAADFILGSKFFISSF